MNSVQLRSVLCSLKEPSSLLDCRMSDVHLVCHPAYVASELVIHTVFIFCGTWACQSHRAGTLL